MDPSQVFSSLFTASFWILVFIIGLIVQSLRWLVENLASQIAEYFPDKYEPWWQWSWRECFLPSAPVILGALIGYFIHEYPYPDPFGTTLWARVFIGTFIGFVSAWGYPRIMYYVRNLAKTPTE